MAKKLTSSFHGIDHLTHRSKLSITNTHNSLDGSQVNSERTKTLICYVTITYMVHELIYIMVLN